MRFRLSLSRVFNSPRTAHGRSEPLIRLIQELLALDDTSLMVTPPITSCVIGYKGTYLVDHA